ncbi:MAG: hypothetical protein GY705_21110 [Bacteroidetes bacterium]|nr:hypothetical protein [Bacteroidota bacterium]
MASLDNPMQDLCRETCPGCDDNCCIRATIYYDFKDLLFLYLYSGRLPQMQIIKQKSCSCPNLASQGCILPRQKRPFVCTWYICPRQKAEIYQAGETSKLVEIEKTIKLIQAARNTLEDTFVENALKKISNHP